MSISLVDVLPMEREKQKRQKLYSMAAWKKNNVLSWLLAKFLFVCVFIDCIEGALFKEQLVMKAESYCSLLTWVYVGKFCFEERNVQWWWLDHNYSEVKTEERGWGKKKREKKPANLKNVVW